MTTKTPASAILYAGPSMLDGSPIVAIATGLGSGSTNAKTGAMVQVWIIRSDVDPITASRTGQDASICGDCPHRGTATPERASGWAKGRSCYVNLVQAPRSVFATYQRGGYAPMELEAFADAIRGKGLRLGAYGDPAAVPFYVWDAICPAAAFCNGYTHAWRRFPELAAWCMASADCEDDRIAAQVLGFRTFRVRHASEQVAAREVICPASEEAGKRTVCASCRACGGHSAKAKADIVIIAHGSGANAFRAAA
jgi:hypothetical protein